VQVKFGAGLKSRSDFEFAGFGIGGDRMFGTFGRVEKVVHAGTRMLEAFGRVLGGTISGCESGSGCVGKVKKLRVCYWVGTRQVAWFVC
jgi:hypothetical protein